MSRRLRGVVSFYTFTYFLLSSSSSIYPMLCDAGDDIGAAIWISRSFCRMFVFASWSHESFGNYLRSDVKKMIISSLFLFLL